MTLSLRRSFVSRIQIVGLALFTFVPDRGAAEDLSARMTEVLRYTGIDNPRPEDSAAMTQLWTRSQENGLTSADRRAAFKEMYLLYYKLHGRDLSGRMQALDTIAHTVAAAFDRGARMDLTLPASRGRPEGRYLHVESYGTGASPLLLISDIGIDGRQLYESFVHRQSAAYSMRIVTLPFAGGARSLPWPERIRVADRPWLTQIENELLEMLDKDDALKPTVIGTAAGGYFAARLALLRPQRIRALVLVNSLVHTSMRSAADPDAPAGEAERALRASTVLPGPQLFPVAALPEPEELKRLIDDPRSLHPAARNWMAFAVKDLIASRHWSFAALSGGFFIPSQVFGWELASTDLTEQFRTLAVPTLVMGSWHDEGSPAVNAPTISQWEEIKLKYPAIPLTISTFADTRAYVSADAPAAFDRALADFIAGQPVRGSDEFSAARSSPRASLMNAVGPAEIRIEYGRPAVKGRKLWGDLVPYGRIWRAGANEATRVTMTRDMLVEGHRLPSGSYTFFVIPREAEWTIIFNRVSRQWGAFDYDPAFDAVRFNIRPAQAQMQEYLRYHLEPTGPAAANLNLNWGELGISMRLEIPQAQ